MAGVPLWLLVLTAGVYLAFAIGYGETVFDTTFEFVDTGCSGFFDCLIDFITDPEVLFGVIGDFLQFITLGGFSGLLPLLVQAPLLILMGAGWVMALLDVVLP